MISDSHLHTSFSTDSDAAPEEVIRAAIRAGMTNLCITDHYDPDYPTGEFMIDPDSYWKEMDRLRGKYRERIRLRIGIEIGLLPDHHDQILRIAESEPFDYVIGSVHVMDGLDPYYRDQFKGTDDEMYRRYFEVMLEDLRNTEGYQALGHLDYVVRYGYGKDADYSYDRFRDVIDPVLREIVDRGIALEVNTAGLTKGMAWPNPHPDVIRRYLQLGGTMITLGSDAHDARVGAEFDRVLPMLRKLGVKEITEFHGKKPVFVKML
jgi:histidinol-phosphatase (PHP family)